MSENLGWHKCQLPNANCQLFISIQNIVDPVLHYKDTRNRAEKKSKGL